MKSRLESGRQASEKYRQAERVPGLVQRSAGLLLFDHKRSDTRCKGTCIGFARCLDALNGCLFDWLVITWHGRF